MKGYDAWKLDNGESCSEYMALHNDPVCNECYEEEIKDSLGEFYCPNCEGDTE